MEQRFNTYTIQVTGTICPKQQLGILQASKQHATASQHNNKRHGHESTNCIDQKTLTDHKPKRIRRYNGTHVNIASYITDSNMAETEL